MKKNYLVGLLFLVGTLCWSCSDDDDSGNAPKDIVLDEDTHTEQVVYADQKGVKNEGIKFTTLGAWTAEVVEVSTTTVATADSKVDWLTLSQYSGDKAGDYTIALTLKQNFTGKPRKAEIRILCAETVITIIVEQKAEKENGVMLKRVKSAKFVETLGDFFASEEETSDNCTFTYTYDEQGRVAKVVQSWEDEASSYLFDYRVAGEITVNELNKDFSSSSEYDYYKCEYVLTLNKQGYVEDIKRDRLNESSDISDIKVSYTQDGRLAMFADAQRIKDYYNKFFYTDGLLTKTEEKVYGYPYVYDAVYDIKKVYPNRYPANVANIDFNAFLLGDRGLDVEMPSLLSQIGLLGKGSDCLMEMWENDYDYNMAHIDGYYEPGIVLKQSEKIIKFREDGMSPVKYEFDGDKYVIEFSCTTPYEVYNHEYEIHVGHELKKPDAPYFGYKYEVKNEKWTKLSDESNTFTWTMTYE